MSARLRRARRWRSAAASSSPSRCRRGAGGRSRSSASPLFEIALGPAAGPRRPVRGAAWLFGFGWLAMGMGWMWQLTVPGYIVASLIFACFHGVAALAAPTGRWRVIGRPAAHTLVEALRFSFPFGGVPLASLGIAQAGGPLVGVARVGGVILITWVVFQLGFALGAIAEAAPRRGDPTGRPFAAASRRWPSSWCSSLVAPRGTGTGRSLDVAAVQGGGEQGTWALDVPSRGRHRTPPRGDPHDRARPGRSTSCCGRRTSSTPSDFATSEELRGDRRRGGPPRRAVRRRHHRGRPRAARPDHQRPGRRHARRRGHEPLRQGAPGPVRRVRAAARASSRRSARRSTRCRRTPSPAPSPAVHRPARRHAARRGRSRGRCSSAAGPARASRHGGEVHPQPDQRGQLHRHDRADPAGRVEPAAGDRDRPLGRAGGADRVLARSSRPTAT